MLASKTPYMEIGVYASNVGPVDPTADWTQVFGRIDVCLHTNATGSAEFWNMATNVQGYASVINARIEDLTGKVAEYANNQTIADNTNKNNLSALQIAEVSLASSSTTMALVTKTIPSLRQESVALSSNISSINVIKTNIENILKELEE